MIRKLKNKGDLFLTAHSIRIGMDKTKWYRIDSSTLHDLIMQNDPSTITELTEPDDQIDPTTRVNLTLAITKELKNIKNKHVETTLDGGFVINY